MFAIVLFFAVAFAQVAKPDQTKCTAIGGTYADGTCTCPNDKKLLASGTTTITYSCDVCSGNTKEYDPVNLKCVTDCPEKQEGSTRTSHVCTTCGQGDLSSYPLYDFHAKQCMGACQAGVTASEGVCKCPDNKVSVTVMVDGVGQLQCQECGQGTVYVKESKACQTKATCGAGHVYLERTNGCECDSSKGFTETGDTEKPCKCTDTNKKIIKETGANNAVTYKCGTCPQGQQYSEQELRCYTPATNCDASKGQVAQFDKCVCNGQLNFENKAAAGAALDCQCKADFNLIEKQEGQTKTVSCAKCEGATPKYDKTKKACVKDGVNGLFLVLATALFFLF